MSNGVMAVVSEQEVGEEGGQSKQQKSGAGSAHERRVEVQACCCCGGEVGDAGRGHEARAAEGESEDFGRDAPVGPPAGPDQSLRVVISASKK